MSPQEFINEVWDHYAHQGRDLPWRHPEEDGSFDLYKILVSEVMLQQTQVSRVIPKYIEWLKDFPDFASLATAPLSRVLTVWSGLGYNRRAKYLHEAAKLIDKKPVELRPDEDFLVSLPGIGRNTARAILAYAYNAPSIFIETNIRAVYIHHFFAKTDQVSDAELIPLIQATLDRENPREWYWALMDYGSHLKITIGNSAKYSKHHVKQSTFKGSRREIRGRILKLLVKRSKLTQKQIVDEISDDRTVRVIDDLVKEGLIIVKKGTVYLAN